MSRLLASSLLAVLILSGCNQPVEDTGPGQPVKHRQEAFKAVLRTFEPMGTMLRDQRFNAGKFVALATELKTLRDGPWPYFTADTHYPPTKAKAAVWERPEAFEQARQAFVDATDALVLAAQSRELAQVQPAYEKVYDSCKACHNDFKDK